MKVTNIHGSEKFSETDFLILLLSYISKNSVFLINLDTLEKRLYNFLKDSDLKDIANIFISEEKKKVDLQKSISFLATLGVVSYYTNGNNEKKCVILIDDKEASEAITKYTLIDEEITIKVNDIANKMYPKTKTDKPKEKLNIINVFNNN